VATLALISVFSILFCHDYIEGFLKLRPQPNFEISANPISITLHSWEGSTDRTIITVKSIGGFSGSITFEVLRVYLIGDLRFTFDSPNVTLPADGQVQCILTFYVCSYIPPEKYYIEVVGIAGNLKHSVRITITVSY